MDLLKKLPIIIGPLLVIFIFSRYVIPGDFIVFFQTASPPFMILSYAFNTLSLFGKAHRLHALLKKSNVILDFFCTLKLYALANLMGQVSNFVVSDIVNVGTLMLNQDKKLRITNIVILNRIADLMAISLIFAISFCLNLSLLSSFINFSLRPVLFFLVILLFTAPLAIYYRRQFLTAYQDLRKLIRGTFIFNLTYLFVIYACFALAAWNDVRTLNLHLSSSLFLLAYTAGSLISVLPISIAGIGTRDILFIFLLGLVDIPPAGAVALSVLGFIIIPALSVLTLLFIAQIGEHYATCRNH